MIVAFALYLFAFTCLSSMTAMDAAATFLALVIVVKAFQLRKQTPGIKIFNWVQFDWIFLVWVSVIILGFIINSTDLQIAIRRTLEFKWVLIWYAVTAAIIYVKPGRKVIPILSLGIWFGCIYAIVASVMGYDYMKVTEVVRVDGSFLSRTGGLYGNPMVLAHCYGVIFCLVAGSLFSWPRWKKMEQFWILSTLILCGTTLLLTFTRGVWISVFFAMIGMGYVHRKKMALIITGIGAGVGAFAILFWEPFRLRMIYAFGPESQDQIRLHLWRTNWEIFKDHPFFGAGYGQNTVLLPEYFERLGIKDMTLISHAHNQVLHLMAGTGIFGAAVFILFNILFLKLNLRVFRAIDANLNYWHKSIALGAFGAQVHFLAGGLFESNFEHAKMKYVMMFAWGSVVWLAYEYGLLKQRTQN